MRRSTSTPRVLLPSLLAAVFVAAAAHAADAQTTLEPSGKFRPVQVRLPDGHMPAPFPEKRVGRLLLNEKRPAGMYVAYPDAGESVEEFNAVLKAIVAGMFIHDPKTPVNWTQSPLPPHKGAENGTATLFVASDGKTEIQLAAYARTFGETVIAYGYYAMRHKAGAGQADGFFLDGSGNGVKEFDKFAQSLRAK